MYGLGAHSKKGCKAGRVVQPIWLEAVSWWLPTVVAGWVLMALWRGKTPKLELSQAPLKVGWGRLTRGLDGDARDMTP